MHRNAAVIMPVIQTRRNLVVIESPYAGDVATNVSYAREAIMDSLSRGESPFASHLLYTQPGILDDEIPEQRRFGIEAGFAWHEVADKIVVYVDLGISAGMRQGIKNARSLGIPVEYRAIKKGIDHGRQTEKPKSAI